MQRVYDADGVRKHIVEQHTFVDMDGSVDTAVWTVVSPRVVGIARKYFGCAALTGVPLMGHNPLGEAQRGSLGWQKHTEYDVVLD